jgi:hypothetical protein
MPRPNGPQFSEYTEGPDDPIVGWNTLFHGTVCRDCSMDNPDLVMENPKLLQPIHVSDVGLSAKMYPQGFTCTGCGTVVGGLDES